MKKRLEILETQLTTSISQLEGMIYNSVIKQTEQLSKELDDKIIFCVNLWVVIFSKMLQIAILQNDIVSESSIQPPDVSKIIDGSFVNSPPQC